MRYRIWKKKLAGGLLLVLFLVISVMVKPETFFAKSKGTFAIEGAEGKAGDTVSVKVKISNNPGITALHLEIHYSATDLKLVSVEDPQLFGNSITMGNTSVQPFLFSWYARDLGNKTKNGTLAILNFKILPSAKTSTISISYDPENVFDNSFENQAFGTKSGKVKITSKKTVFQVTYKDGGKTVKKEKVKKGGKPSLPVRTKKGYRFKGWYTKKSGGKKAGPKTKITKKTTLYAHWRKV